MKKEKADGPREFGEIQKLHSDAPRGDCAGASCRRPWLKLQPCKLQTFSLQTRGTAVATKYTGRLQVARLGSYENDAVNNLVHSDASSFSQDFCKHTSRSASSISEKEKESCLYPV